MFRIAKQLEISRLINECNTVEELCQWFRVFVNQIGLKEGKKFAATAFLKSKAQFNSQIIDQLIESGSTQLHECNQLKADDIKSVETNLDLLPNGVFFHVSFYLSLKTCLNLSMTSHSFHKKIQTTPCLGMIKDCDTVQLNPTTMTTIAQNNCIMQCVHKFTHIEIKTMDNHKYSNCDCTNCPLSRLIDKINTGNYDLLWFKTIWKNITQIFVCNQYPCALKHIPISWILEDKNQDLEPIDVIGASKHVAREGLIDESIVKNFAKSVKNHINDNPDKTIRKIQRIWYDSDECDPIEIYSSFGDNLTGILLCLPRLWDNKCRFQDLETFFKIFHKNVNWLEIDTYFDRVNHNIVSQLFKNNQQLCDDLNKTEKQLSFDQFLKKYNCENQCLTTTEYLVINVGDNDADCKECVLFELFNNDKIVKLLNIEESIESLRINVKTPKRRIKNLMPLAVSKLNNLEECSCRVRLNDELKSSQEETLIQEFFQLANEFLLQMVTKRKGEYVLLTVDPPELTCTGAKNLDYTINIENKNELLYANRDVLQSKISSIVDQSIEAVKKIWCQTR